MSNKLQNVLNEIKLEKDTNLLPENIKKDVKIFDIVGTLEGASADVPVKLFETQEEMQADETAEEGDLALVYREEIQNWDGTSAISSFTFLKTVVLPSAMTGSCYGYGEGDTWIDIQGDITSTKAYFRLMGDDYYTINYTSADGITYTRTDSYDETIIISENAVEIEMYEFSEVCGYFMRIGGSVFDGLYQYQIEWTNENQRLLPLMTNIEVDFANNVTTFDTTNNDCSVDSTKILKLANKIADDNSISNLLCSVFLDTDDKLHLIPSVGNKNITSMYSHDELEQYPAFAVSSSTDKDVVYTDYVLDIINETYIATSIPFTTANYGVNNYRYCSDIILKTYPIDLFIRSTVNQGSFWHKTANHIGPFKLKDTVTVENNVGGIDVSDVWLKENKYILAPTQLTLSNESELFPGKIGYGKNGVITGDGSIYNNLDKEAMFLQTLGMTKQLDKERYCIYDTTKTPYTIGSYEINIAKYISETTDMENADYVLGKLVDYKTLQSITNISGIIYSQAYFTKSAVDDTYFVFVKQATDNTYHILQINTTFTEIIDDILVECTEAYCDICNDHIMMLRVTDSTSETPYKYVIFNYVEKELVTLIPASANSYTSSTIFVSDRHLTIVNNNTTYLYDIRHNTVMTVGETESNLRRTDIFMFAAFIYIAKTMNDGSTVTRKLYKYTDETQLLELHATYTGGSYLSMYNTTVQIGMHCIETDTYILDYGQNIVYAKQNITGNSNSIARTKCNINGKTINSALYYQGDNSISDSINYTFVVPDTSAITVTDSAIDSFTYSVIPSGFGKLFHRGTAISEDYDTDTAQYKLQSFEFNYSGATVLSGLVRFKYSGFNAYAEYDIKYYNDVLNDADYMLLKTSFKSNENISIAPYLKLFSLKPVALSVEEYDTALNTVDEILGEEV